ncbi:MAG: biotin/lipoyl-containing protein, partial [Solirubrobacteraceae bacterium]
GIRAAAGEPLSVTQEDIVLRGHAIECRINAEDAARNFAPAPGRISAYVEPSGPGVRVDSGVRAGSEVSPTYDPMISKLIVCDRDREQATQRMLRALGEYEIEGLQTLIGFHRALLSSEQWARAETCRDLLEDEAWLTALAPEPPDGDGDGDDSGDAGAVEQTYMVEVSGRRFDVRVIGPPSAAQGNGATPDAPPKPFRAERAKGAGSGGDTLSSPLQGNVWKVPVAQGQQVQEGQVIVILEAMKMENEITAHKAGKVAELPISVGSSVATGDTLAVIQ